MNPENPQLYRLSIIEKRSIAYARLELADKEAFNLKGQVFVPTRVAYIPSATLGWIEHLLIKGESDWPWFAVVLKFVNSKEYARIESLIQDELRQAKEEDNFFWERLKNSRTPAISAPDFISNHETRLSSIKPMTHINPRNHTQRRSNFEQGLNAMDRYFWDTIDPNWWREQE